MHFLAYELLGGEYSSLSQKIDLPACTKGRDGPLQGFPKVTCTALLLRHGGVAQGLSLCIPHLSEMGPLCR